MVYRFKNSHIDNGDHVTASWYAEEVVYPDGETLTYDYETASAGLFDAYRPTSITSTTGYRLELSYHGDTLGELAWNAVKEAKIVYVDTEEILAKQEYSSGTELTITNLQGRVWGYEGFSNSLGNTEKARNYTFTLPGNSDESISVQSAELEYQGVTHNNFVTHVTRDGKSYGYEYTAKSGQGYDPRKQFEKLVITGPNNYQREITYLVGNTSFSTSIHS